MDSVVFDTLTRRASLVAGAAGLAALVLPIAAASKKKKKKKEDVNKLCKQEANDCIATLSAACQEQPDVAACLATVQTCCPELATCDFIGFTDCLVANEA